MLETVVNANMSQFFALTLEDANLYVDMSVPFVLQPGSFFPVLEGALG